MYIYVYVSRSYTVYNIHYRYLNHPVGCLSHFTFYPGPIVSPSKWWVECPFVAVTSIWRTKKCRSCLQENHGNSVMLINFRINIIQDGVIYIYTWTPKRLYFFGHFAYDHIFWSYGIYAKIPNSKLHACGGNHDTSIFQYVSNMFSIICQYFSIFFFNIVQSCNFSISFQYVSKIYQYSSNMPLVAKYRQIWAYDQEILSFLQIRQYSVK